MEAFGFHYIGELSRCKSEYLGDPDSIRGIIMQAAIEAKAEIREVAVHKFSPQGVSGVVVIAESHLSIHTWPEYAYAAIDIFTCGKHTLPQAACDYIAKHLEAGEVSLTVIERGIEYAPGSFGQKIKERPLLPV